MEKGTQKKGVAQIEQSDTLENFSDCESHPRGCGLNLSTISVKTVFSVGRLQSNTQRVFKGSLKSI